MTDEERFWSKVDKSGGPDACWNWMAGKSGAGYGYISWRKKHMKAHRVAYELANGQIPQHDSYHGICICHRCDNRACVNPAHLFAGTNHDNIRDRDAKGRHGAASHPDRMARPYKLTPELVIEIRRLYADGVSTRDIAGRFGITRRYAQSVVRGDNWHWLEKSA